MRKLLRALPILLPIILIIAAAVAIGRSSFVRLQSVEVVLDPASHDAFQFTKIHSGLQASLAHFTGLPFWRVSLDDVMKEVRRDQRVRLARIQREFPHSLRVVVVPQEPLLGYMDEKGRIFPVAQDATLMPAVSLKDAPGFPLLRGKEFETSLALRQSAVQLIETIDQQGFLTRAKVSEIMHSSKYGFELFLSDHSAEVKLGEGEFGLKVSRIEKVLSYLHNRNINGRVVDARFSRKVVVRIRNH